MLLLARPMPPWVMMESSVLSEQKQLGRDNTELSMYMMVRHMQVSTIDIDCHLSALILVKFCLC
jgi:hypothetical protein